MKKYQIREYEKNKWDVICHCGEYVFGSPDAFDSRMDAMILADELEKNNPNPNEEFFGDWLMIDKN